MNTHVISVTNILGMLVASTELEFSVAICRYIFFVNRTMLAIEKAIRLFLPENKFYVYIFMYPSQQFSICTYSAIWKILFCLTSTIFIFIFFLFFSCAECNNNCGNNQSWLLDLNLTCGTQRRRAVSGLLISMLEKLRQI